MKNIILVGYMGSGKSTIGKKLAKLVNFDFVDLDEFLEIKLNSSIQNIFETKGEIFFRKTENLLLEELLLKKEKSIISLGGGTPCFTNNSTILFTKEHTTIYLKASIDKLFERLMNQKSKRPLIAHLETEELKEFIAKHLFERNGFYSQSTFTINVDNKMPNEIVSEIKELLF